MLLYAVCCMFRCTILTFHVFPSARFLMWCFFMQSAACLDVQSLRFTDTQAWQTSYPIMQLSLLTYFCLQKLTVAWQQSVGLHKILHASGLLRRSSESLRHPSLTETIWMGQFCSSRFLLECHSMVSLAVFFLVMFKCIGCLTGCTYAVLVFTVLPSAYLNASYGFIVESFANSSEV